MRVLISAVGTRGDVQPVFALAVALRAQGHQASLCIPPNFMDWATQLGFKATPVGVAMRAPGRSSAPPSPKQEDMISDLVTDQFTQLGQAVEDNEIIVAAGAFQFAARSIAELKGLPYVNAVYAPITIPSADLPPRANPGKVWLPGDSETNLQRWDANLQKLNESFLARVNQNRQALGLPAVDDVTRHIFAERPLLAADPLLGPAPEGLGMTIISTGAWLLADADALTPELEAFLDAGEPPIYFGLGSMPAAPGLSLIFLEAARKLGRRAIVSQGWSDFEPLDDAPDCLMIADVNQQALFPRVAAVVHHGGAGTTTTAARAGSAQLITPMFSDQFYWAHRVRQLGIGSSASSMGLDAQSLAAALELTLAPTVADQARQIAAKVKTDGAEVAAREIIARGK